MGLQWAESEKIPHREDRRGGRRGSPLCLSDLEGLYRRPNPGSENSNSGKANSLFNLEMDLRHLLPLLSLAGEKPIPAQSVFYCPGSSSDFLKCGGRKKCASLCGHSGGTPPRYTAAALKGLERADKYPPGMRQENLPA